MNPEITPSVPARRSSMLTAGMTVLVIAYLVIGTGIFSDDYALIATLAGLTPAEMIWPTASSLATPLTHLTHEWFYYLIQDRRLYLYDGIKIIYLVFSLALLRRFFSLWFDQYKAFIVAGLFVFYPIHDAVTYWFIGQYLLLSFALFAWSFYLLQGGRIAAALAAGLAGSFISYGSSAVACGLALIFLLRRDFRRAALFLLPNLIYVAYYLGLTAYLEKGVGRLPGSFDFASVLKQFLLQIVTFADVAAGPSYWLKMLLAFGEISFISVLVAGLVMFLVMRLPHEPVRGAAPMELVWGAAGVTIAAFAMFAITGFYPQLAFNLGDRVTIFGNFLMIVLIASLPLRRTQWLVVVGIYVLVIFGISDHWKASQKQQQAVIGNIAANAALQKIPPGATLYVTGNQYSHFGGISDIEFLSESFVASAVFALARREAPAYQVVSLNQRYHFDGEALVDRKYKTTRQVGESILIYDSTKDRIVELTTAGINAYLDQLPLERRHWIQFLDAGPLRRAILHLMPRLEYAF